MDPPLINESSFYSANPSSYSLDGIWPLTSEVNISGSSGNSGGSPEFEQGGCGRKRKDSTSHIPSNSTSKRGKMVDNLAPKPKVEARETKKVEQISKNLDPHKDYIHVRARRGQATDSHSLAERARREKISERMKILQDIVPGCNKIIGKALVLDEIINYIQSLQQQVEFLSMKLEEVNSRMMIQATINGFPAKDLFDATAMTLIPRVSAEGSRNEWLHVQLGNNFER